MRGAYVLASGAVSALGSGDFAFRVGEIGERAKIAIGRDEWLEREGLLRPVAARVSGVEAIRATTATLPRPFRVGRDGMALGEGAAILALARESVGPTRGYVAGFGASTDAVHLTAPDATGRGLATAAKLALADAAID